MENKKTIMALGMVLFSLSFAFCLTLNQTTIYGGETYPIPTNFTNPVYTVTGNSSNLEGLNVTFENGTIKVTPAINYKPDNFTMIFFDNITNTVIDTVYVGGGHSTKYINVTQNVTVYVPEYINCSINDSIQDNNSGGTIIKTDEIEEINYAPKIIFILVILGVLVYLFFKVRNKKKQMFK